MVNYRLNFKLCQPWPQVLALEQEPPVRVYPDHPPKSCQKRQFLIDSPAIRNRRNSSICSRSKFLIDSKTGVLREQKRKKGEANGVGLAFSSH